MPRPLLVPALMLVALATGCPAPKKTSNPDGGLSPVDFVGRSCNVDAECGDLRCDKVRRQCICLSDESCKSPNLEDPVRYCNNYTGLCVEEIAGCKSDAECEATQFCDSAIRACRPKRTFCEPCAADNECGGVDDDCLLDATLNKKFCATACASNADCPRGATCQDQGGELKCWPAPNELQPEQSSCEGFQGCVPDSLRTCASNADCAELGDQRCDTARGKCVALRQTCPFGTACDPRNRICVAECTADADCGEPALRCNNRICEPASECTDDNQCPANRICSIPTGATAGTCEPFCQSDADCPIGNQCRRGADGKYRCEPGCATHANCPLDQRCGAAGQCEGPVVGTTRVCQSTPSCDTCQLCDAAKYECVSAKSAFPYCNPCTPGGTQCPGGACVGMDDGAFCAQLCGAGQQCPQGFVCLGIGGGAQSACVPADRKCTNKCP